MPSKSNSKAGRDKQENVDFLVDTFGVASPKAADLIAEDDREAERLSRKANEHQHATDDLADAPVPEAPEDDFVADSDEDQLKPVLRNRKG